MSDDLIAEAEIGNEARKFVESDLGKTLLGMAEQDLKLAQEGLETVDLSDTAKARKLQDDAKHARNFNNWLVELITRGEAAMNVWKQQQETS